MSECQSSNNRLPNCSFEEDANSRLGTFIKRAEQALISAKTEILRQYELTVPQYATMMSLLYSDGQSAAQLARVALVTPQTMSTILKNLESKSLVKKTASSLHVRVVVNSLTEKGQGLVLQADQQIRTLENNLASQFSEGGLESFKESLRNTEDFLRNQ